LLGKRLIELRGNRTQKLVAEQLGISRSRYSHYENNYAEPDTTLLQKMSEFYNVSIDYLLGRTDEKFNLNEQKFMKDLSTISIDEIIKKYPLVYEGEVLYLSDDDKRALLAFIKTLQNLKKEEL